MKRSDEMLQKVLPGSTHRQNAMPQPRVLLKIQNIHYRFTWKNKVVVLKWNVAGQNLRTSESDIWICQICSGRNTRSNRVHSLCFTSQSSLLCKITQLNIHLREGKHIAESRKKIPSQPVLHISSAERALTSFWWAGEENRAHHSNTDSQKRWNYSDGFFQTTNSAF